MIRKRHEYLAAGLLTKEESDLICRWKAGERNPQTLAAARRLSQLQAEDRAASRREKALNRPVEANRRQTIADFVREGRMTSDEYAGARAYDRGNRTDWARAGRAAYIRLREADIRGRNPRKKPDLLPVPDAERSRIWRKIRKAKAEGLSPEHATELVAITWNCGCHRCQLYRMNHGT